MEQDRQFSQWITQNSSLENPAVTYTTQPTELSLPPQSSTFQGNTTQVPFVTPPQAIQSTQPSHYQYFHEGQHNIVIDESQPQYLHQTPQPYSPVNGAPFLTEQQPHYLPPSYPSQQRNGYDSSISKTSRLSDENENHGPDAELKMVTSKERRQLRNKISARNFRNRRKEYISSLEEEVDKFKNENCQLRLEIKWVRSTMNKLQGENDQLRVKLALCHNGIKTDQDIVPVISSTSLPSSPEQLSSTPVTATTEQRNLSSSTSAFSSNFLDRQTQSGNSQDFAPDPRILTSLLPDTIGQHTTPSLSIARSQPTDLNNRLADTTLPPQAIVDSICSNRSHASSTQNILRSQSNFAQPIHTWGMATPSYPSSYGPLQQETTPLIASDMVQDIQQSNNTPISLQQQNHPSSLDHNNSNNRYIEASIFPAFNAGHILTKNDVPGSNNQLFLDYPLLVVALVSIIISHTLSMTTNELLSHTRSLPDKRSNHFDEEDLKHTLQPSTHDDLLAKKETQAMWAALINEMVKRQQDNPTKDRQEQLLNTSATAIMDNKDNEDLWYDVPVTGFQAICPLYWLQRLLCRFVITYVVVKYPQLEIPCKTYLPICKQFRRRVTQA